MVLEMGKERIWRLGVGDYIGIYTLLSLSLPLPQS